MGPFHRTAREGQPLADVESRVISPRGNALPGVNNAHTPRRRGRHHGYQRFWEWLLLALLALCIVASFVRFHSHVKELEAQRLRPSAPIDVVGVSLKPSCVTRQAVASLNLHLKPRIIHVVTTNADKCKIYASFAPNVVCHLQDDFLDGLTVERVGQYIQHSLGLDQHKHFKGRELSGWYMQQFLKLGSALALPGLSDHYLVWDLDMILLSPVQLLWPDPSAPAASDASDPAASEAPVVQTLVNVGGSIAPGYMATFRRLMRRSVEFAPDGSSFVTHWMVVYKPYLLEFLRELSAGEGRLGWVWRILAAVEPSSADLGFSEYASYISWVRQRYPGSQRLASRKTWVRHPFGQATVRLLRLLRADRCCCPSAWLLRMLRALGFVYTGYEVGHIDECRYSAPEYGTAYGL
ncbi:hypothetical protein TSOC_004131 [Tetrabaena socialis]|uniref:Uncharacterized protein n=1 Tax=Tetrabaena socialis TaxID=47790 RepID=A0A2J8A9W2_9CHLO|nr:hypothetical protein TSOC_004131 [Tetrabaena socialis]|eukprot:PNH09273.1 hypothetical protein TSOC_004131 [Tetrabaena socialis]